MDSESPLTVNDLPSDVVDAIKDGKKIEAIKRLRLETGIGLANAKVLVDAAARKHGVQSVRPALMHVETDNSGLLKLVLLLLTAVTAYQYFA